LEGEGFTGKESSAVLANPLEKTNGTRLIVLGLGPRAGWSAEALRRAGGRLARKAREIRMEEIAVEWPRAFTEEHLFAFAEGVLLGSYQFTRYKTPSKDICQGIKKIHIGLKKERKQKADRFLAKAQAYGEGVLLARDLINGAPSDVTPRVLVDTARKIAKGSIHLKVFGKKELIKMGAGGLLGVNRGSAQDPYLIHLHYKPSGKSKKSLAIVGKGITFDSGGLSLKPASAMETMKMDMSGAAAVLGVFSQLGQIKPRVEVHGIIPTTENMPGGRAYKPGDVLKAMNGKTMEVLNTDAEGRLILSDALSYADRLKVDGMVDLATLTGACVVALGSLMAGALSNDQALLGRIKAATEAEGETIWELPLFKEYREDIKSKVADIKNIGTGREAGTITAALFLQEFVGNRPWVHLDIAGPAYLEREYPSIPYLTYGGTGLMVRSLLHFLENE
jgi:leucyl aminopeptidase